jgi:hypothetical protein
MIKHSRVIFLLLKIYQLIIGVLFLFYLYFFDINDKLFLLFLCGILAPPLILFQVYAVIIRKGIPKESIIYKKYKGYRRTFKNEYEILFWKIKKDELTLINSNEIKEVIISVNQWRKFVIIYFLLITILSIITAMVIHIY